MTAAIRWRASRLLLALGAAVTGVAPLARSAAAQGGGAQAVRRVEGRVVMPRDGNVVGTPGIMVTLHRVGPDTAGPVDSMRTGPDGRYVFRYRPFGAEQALYFVSASHAGIAHFSPPLRGASVTGEDAEVTVYDTTSKALGVTVRGRHVVVSTPAVASAGGESRRTVIEVYELSNDSTRTMVSGEGSGERPTWTAILPPGATNFQVGQGDVSEDAVSFTNGRVLVYAPFAPGLKQVSFSYMLPASAFPLRIPVEHPTEVLEVLIEEPEGRATGAGLAAQGPVDAEGRTFQRFLAQGAPANAVATVTIEESGGSSRTLYILLVALALGVAMLIGLARAFTRRSSATVVPRLGDDDPDVLARQIAALDATYEADGAQDDAARAAYAERRARLKERLSDALARRAANR